MVTADARVSWCAHTRPSNATYVIWRAHVLATRALARPRKHALTLWYLLPHVASPARGFTRAFSDAARGSLLERDVRDLARPRTVIRALAAHVNTPTRCGISRTWLLPHMGLHMRILMPHVACCARAFCRTCLDHVRPRRSPAHTPTDSSGEMATMCMAFQADSTLRRGT